jgi:hypothetical protein
MKWIWCTIYQGIHPILTASIKSDNQASKRSAWSSHLSLALPLDICVYVTSCTCSRRAPATAPTATACHRPHPVPQEGNLPGLRQEDFKEVVRQVLVLHLLLTPVASASFSTNRGPPPMAFLRAGLRPTARTIPHPPPLRLPMPSLAHRARQHLPTRSLFYLRWSAPLAPMLPSPHRHVPRRPLVHNRLQSASPAWCMGRASHPCAHSGTTLPCGHSQAPPHARWRRSQCPRHGCAPSMAATTATTARPSTVAAANPTAQDRPPDKGRMVGESLKHQNRS